MKKWKKVDYFAEGVIYACGNQRKIVTPGKPDVYFEVKGEEVRWHATGGPWQSGRVGEKKAVEELSGLSR